MVKIQQISFLIYQYSAVQFCLAPCKKSNFNTVLIKTGGKTKVKKGKAEGRRSEIVVLYLCHHTS